MRKLLIALTLLALSSTSSFAVSGVELAENSKPATPTRSEFLPNQEMIVKRYVLPQESAVAVHNLVDSVVSEMGSSKEKRINIIWTDRSSKQSANRVRDALLKRKVKSNTIQITRSQIKRDIYPLYVEVKHIGVKRFDCKVTTAEDMMSFDPYNACASKSNSRIQLKN